MTRMPTEALGLTAAFAVGLALSPATGQAIVDLRSASAVLVIAGLSVVYGRVCGRLLRLPPHAVYRRPGELIAGFSSLSLVHLTATALLNVSALVALSVDVTAGVVLLLVSSRRDTPGSTVGAESRPPGPPVWNDALLVVGCAALIAFWARETVFAVPHAEASGVFRTWQDYFLHASEITYLRDYPAFDRTSLYLAGAPQPLYHRASYAMSAVLSAVGSVPSLETATTFWLPTGLLLCALGIYSFGAALGGRLAGVAAVAAVFLWPDPSTYGFRNQFLGFHWLVQMAAGSGYAVSLILLALVVLVSATPRRKRAWLSAAVLVGASVAFRVHIGLLAGSMLVALACLSQRRALTRWRVAAILITIATMGAAAWWMESMALAPHFFSGRSDPLTFLLLVHSQANNIATPFTNWTAGQNAAVTFVFGYVMMLAAGCGVMLPALIAAWLLGMLRGTGWRTGAIPCALILAHLAIILLVPTPAHGDVTDFGHRPFVLVYIVTAAMVGAAVGRNLGAWSLERFHSSRPALLILVGLCAIGTTTPWLGGANLQQRWKSIYSTIPIGADDFAAGRFVRQHSSPPELVVCATADPLAVFVALTERGALVSRGPLYRLLGGVDGALAQQRATALETLNDTPTFDELRAFGRAHGVRWYIADSPAARKWPAAVKAQCVYCGDAVQVYDLR